MGDRERLFSLIGGGLSLFLALRRPSLGALPLAAGGSYLLYRGLRGNDPVYEALNIQRSETGGALVVDRSVTINRPRGEVFAFWRNFANLPRFMEHLQEVRVEADGRRSHWVTSAPLGQTVEWDAQISDERPDELIVWESLPGADVENSGRVVFRDTLDDTGTIVEVHLEYRPPLGAPSVVVACLFGEQPWQQVRDDLRRFKQVMEAGEVPTIFAQSSGRLDEVSKERQALAGSSSRR